MVNCEKNLFLSAHIFNYIRRVCSYVCKAQCTLAHKVLWFTKVFHSVLCIFSYSNWRVILYTQNLKRIHFLNINQKSPINKSIEDLCLIFAAFWKESQLRGKRLGGKKGILSEKSKSYKNLKQILTLLWW